MISLFRKLRIKSIWKDSIIRYSLYAIGEIFLVVIGILLALYINNQNEEENNRKNTIRIFTEIQKDLLNDIEELEMSSNWAYRMDSIANRILEGKMTRTDYLDKENRQLLLFGRSTYPVVISDQSFRLLNDHKEKIPAEYNEVLKTLTSMYVEDQTFLAKVQDEFEDMRSDYKNFLFDNYDWPVDLELNRYSPEAIDYHLNDPIFKRKVLSYKDRLSIKLFYMTRIQEKGIQNFFLLNSITKSYTDLPDILLKLGFDKTEFDADSYIGKYKRVDTLSVDTYEIVEVRGFAYWRRVNESLFYGEGTLLYEIAPDSLGFIFTDEYTFKFYRDSDNNVIGFRGFHYKEADSDFNRINDD